MGQLVSSEVLPKVAAELKKSALAGGAFEQALKGLRVTEGQLMTESQRAGNTIFKSGFEEGLSSLYKTISELLKTSGPQLEKLGKIFGNVFKGVAHVIKVLEPTLKMFIDNMELIVGTAALYKLARMQKAVRLFSTATAAGMARAFLPIYAAVAALEEISSFFSDSIVGNFEASMGHQINIGEKKVSKIVEKDGKLFKGETVADYSFGKGSYGAAVEDRQKGLEDHSVMGNILSYTALGKLSTFITGAYDYATKAESVGTTRPLVTPPQITINNTFNNKDYNEMARIHQLQSVMGMSTTK